MPPPLTFSEFDSYRLTTTFTEDGQFIHTSADAPAEQWSRVERIGDGAFGTVWKEECAQKGAVRAVKQIRRRHVRNTGEMLALTKMNPYSQYFVQFFGWFADEEHVYLAMEYMPCGDLEGLIAEERDMTEGEVKSVAIQLVEGLEIMHMHDFCHRDLKPQNILIVKWFPLLVKIADFGIAKHTSDNTELLTVAGSNDYIAPEILNFLECNTSKYTNAVDIWSLGCLVYKMITRETPFPGARGLLVYVQGKAPFPESRLDEKRSTAVGFVKSLMMPKPQDRLTAAAARTHLWLKEELSDTWEQSSMDPVPPKQRRVEAPLVQKSVGKKSRKEQALVTAAANGYLDIVRILLEKGADANSTSRGFAGLHQAARFGHLEVAKVLIKEGADVSIIEDIQGYTPLHFAADEGHVEIVRVLLENGADFEVLDKYGRTAFHCAVKNGNRKIMELLLEAGSDISGLTTNKDSPLIIASWQNHLEIARFLLEKGADVQWRGEGGLYTALHGAAHQGHLEMVELLLRHGADIAAKDVDGYTVLHRTAQRGFLDAVKLLLNNGADVLERTDRGSTALILASELGHTEVVKLLLENGADVMAKDGDGFLALHWAAQKKKVEIVKLLVDNGPQALRKLDNFQFTILHRAAHSGDLHTVQFVLKQRGTDMTARESMGRTALHLAVDAESDPLEVVNLLMARGLKIATRDLEGCTVLHRAVQGGYLEVVRLLLNRGASIEERNKEGATPFVMAAHTTRARVEILQLLLDQGANITEKDKKGHTAFHKAALNGQVGALRFLLKNGADVREKCGDDGVTALALAAYGNSVEAVRFLLDHGAEDLSRVDNMETALHAAARTGNKEMARLLLKRGANINAKNHEGSTALELASQKGHKEVVVLLLEWDPAERFEEDDENAGRPKVEENTLTMAAEDGDLDTLKLLIDQGADIFAKDHEGYTAIHRAASRGFQHAVRLLLEKGADVTERDLQGFTPLHLSVEFGHLEVTKLLLDRGANPNARSITNITPIIMAVHCGHISIAEYLLSKGADIRARSLSDMLSINLAAQNGDPEMFELMLRGGADPQWKGTHGHTPLHDAAQFGHLEVARRLLEPAHPDISPADMDAENNDQLTPLVLAAEYGHLDVLRLLVGKASERGDPGYVRLSIPIGEGLARARSNGHWEVGEFLDSLLSVYHSHDQFVGSYRPPAASAASISAGGDSILAGGDSIPEDGDGALPGLVELEQDAEYATAEEDVSDAEAQETPNTNNSDQARRVEEEALAPPPRVARRQYKYMDTIESLGDPPSRPRQQQRLMSNLPQKAICVVS